MGEAATQKIFEEAVKLHRAGRAAQAEKLYAQVLAREPRHVEALHLMGLLARQTGRAELAVECISRAIARAPAVAEFYSNLGLALADAGRHSEALMALRRSVELKPELAAGHFNLGTVLHDCGDVDGAIACYQRAIELNPTYAAAHNSLGEALRTVGRAEEAIESYRQAIAARGDFAEPHNNVGSVLVLVGKLEEAITCYRQAIALRPGYANAHANLGNALRQAGRLAESVQEIERAIAFAPRDARVKANLAASLLVQGRVIQAVETLREAVQIEPGNAQVHSNLLLAMQYWRSDDDEVFREHLKWGEKFARSGTDLVPDGSPLTPPLGSGERSAPLRIGYVSSDFRQHSVGFFVEPILAGHDRSAVEVFCYSGAGRADEVTRRMQSYAVHWRDVGGASDAALVEQIRADGIDVLVDLSGHTAGNRLGVFARRAAPVQMTYLGYPDTTALAEMDYRISDRCADPVGLTERWHTEKLLRLERTAWCYRPAVDAPEVQARAGAEVVFASFNMLAKLSPQTVAAWGRILREVPGARLMLKSNGLADAPTRELVAARFAELGVEARRLEMVGSDRTLADHLRRYGQVDIALDPFPYNGTTTTCEAMWMGVPVVGLAGTASAGRVGYSLLNSVGLGELVAESVDDYMLIAIELARDAERRRALRMEMRQRLRSSPLMDGKGLARALEVLYRDACAGRRA